MFPAMAPAYKLTYFDGRGVAEAARFLFKYGEVEFEDVRVKRDDWPQLKESKSNFFLNTRCFLIFIVETPFGQLPVLEHNGKQIGQSISICRYLAKVVKLTGNDDWENLEIDATVDTINDLRQSNMHFFYFFVQKVFILFVFMSEISAAHWEQDAEKKKKLRETLLNETIPYYLQRLEAQAQKNKGYLVLGHVSYLCVL